MSTAEVEPSDLGHDEMVPIMRDTGRWEGIFGFVNTVRAHTLEAGLDPDKVLRHLEFRHYLPELYGGAVMVTRDFAEKNPEAVRALLAAINLSLKDTIADPDAAIAAVASRILAGAALITNAKGLSRVRDPVEVFDRQFLPPFGQRARSNNSMPCCERISPQPSWRPSRGMLAGWRKRSRRSGRSRRRSPCMRQWWHSSGRCRRTSFWPFSTGIPISAEPMCAAAVSRRSRMRSRVPSASML
jgi:hypothetical protein